MPERGPPIKNNSAHIGQSHALISSFMGISQSCGGLRRWASAPVLPGLAVLRVPPKCTLPQLRGCVHCWVHPGIWGCVRRLQWPAAPLQLKKRVSLKTSSR